ncbi:MAG: polyhydroxyalkanoate synthesis regulator [Syntrophomonadaceae bacterium]|nr:polyhydroxyalkanoate synthesis regulator [Syntrophomonadaceae bacterium]
MKSLFDRMFTLGLGAITVTKERAELFFDEMVERGEISREEAKQTMDEVMQKGKEQQEEFRKMIREEMENWKNTFGFATKADIDKLNERIKDLESKLP